MNMMRACTAHRRKNFLLIVMMRIFTRDVNNAAATNKPLSNDIDNVMSSIMRADLCAVRGMMSDTILSQMIVIFSYAYHHSVWPKSIILTCCLHCRQYSVEALFLFARCSAALQTYARIDNIITYINDKYNILPLNICV